MTSSVAVDDPAHPARPTYDQPVPAERPPVQWHIEREVSVGRERL